ncbi:hypothetical protein HAP94_22005 [Acidithiobacillus ferrivorans]|nr:hypothetical protein [Acidithiobacillus ferrivorans]
MANNVVVSGGDVTVAPGSKIGAGFLLVAGAGNVNVGAVATNYGTSSAISPTIAAGYGFTETTTGGVYATGSAINTNATLTFNNASGTIGVTSLAAGNVNVLGGANVSLTGSVAAATIGNNLVNSGTLTVPNGLTAGGSFTNNGIFNASSASVTLAANGNGATLVNNGVVNMSSAGILSLSATSGGTVTNNGVINFDVSSGNSLAVVTGSLNVNLYGAVNQASSAGATPTALSATNALGSVSLVASTSGGVLNLGTTLYSDNTGSDKLQGAAVRVLSGGYTNTSSGTLDVTLGSGKVGNYGYNLSLFPGASLSASTANITGSDTTNGSNVNLFGTITGSAINVSANTINANSAGGFSVSSGGTLTLNVAGNVNNPNGAAAAGSSAFNYNFVPVTMQGTGGTLTVNPSSYASQAQFINVLVTGNATLGALSYATTNPLAIGANIVPNASYPNSHLVVSATGNLSLGGLYWPGMLYLANVSSASNPTVLSSSGTINFTGNVSNVIPTNVTSGGGIWFMTNKALGSLGTSTILTNTNSYVNFPLASGLAVAYGKINTNFYGAVPNANSSNLLTTQLLPSAYIYGR